MQQHPHYLMTLQALGVQAQAYRINHGQGHSTRVQVIQRKLGLLRLAWVPRGPAWPTDLPAAQKRDVLARLARRLPPKTMRLITPDGTSDAELLRELRYREVAAGQQFARMDLRPSEAARLALQHGKWRNRLRHAQAGNLRTYSRAFDPEHDQMLLSLEDTQRRRLGYRTLPAAFTRAWASANPGTAQLFVAEDEAGLAAFVLMLLHAPSASYHIGWTSSRGRLKSAHNLLLWQAANWLAEQGIHTLDLGLIDAGRSPGLTRFKLGMGAQPHATAPTMIAMPRLRLPKIRRRAA